MKEVGLLAAERLGLNASDTELLVNDLIEFSNELQTKLIEARIRANTIPVDMNEVEDSYTNGYQTGLNWVYDYVPGGPFHYGASEHESDFAKWMSAQSKAEHAAWMQGWHDGKAAQA